MGGARLTASGSSYSLSSVENAWVFAPGGGMSVRLNRRFSIVPIAMEDYITRFTGDTSGVHETQNNFRITSGVTIHLGSH